MRLLLAIVNFAWGLVAIALSKHYYIHLRVNPQEWFFENLISVALFILGCFGLLLGGLSIAGWLQRRI